MPREIGQSGTPCSLASRICGLEVVLPSGELVRTGMGAMSTAETWQQFKYGFGPIVDGIFSQSNFGIVTKMGFWLYPEPEAYFSGTVRVAHHDDVIPFVETLANLMYSGVVNCQLGVFSPVFNGAPDPEFKALLAKPDGGSPAEWNAFAAARGRHFWESELHFYGPAKVVAAQWEHVKDRFSVIPGATFVDGVTYRFPLSDAQIEKIGDRASLGIPSLSIFSTLMDLKSDAKVTGHLDISPVLPLSGEAILKAHRVFTQALHEVDIEPVYGFAQSYHWRSFIMFYGLPVTQDAALNAKTRATYEHLMKLAAEHGWGTYRTHVAFMDKVAETYDFNGHALQHLHETLKDALDPKGILSAGRYAIWPKHLRGAKA